MGPRLLQRLMTRRQVTTIKYQGTDKVEREVLERIREQRVCGGKNSYAVLELILERNCTVCLYNFRLTDSAEFET